LLEVSHISFIDRAEDRAETDERSRRRPRVVSPHGDFRGEGQTAEASAELASRVDGERHLTGDQRARLTDVQQLDAVPQLETDNFFSMQLGARPSPAFGRSRHRSHALGNWLAVSINPRLDLREQRRWHGQEFESDEVTLAAIGADGLPHVPYLNASGHLLSVAIHRDVVDRLRSQWNGRLHKGAAAADVQKRQSNDSLERAPQLPNDFKTRTSSAIS
jgi:hypothetical protein